MERLGFIAVLLVVALRAGAQAPPVAVITEFNIQAGAFPHDPALDPADMLWYTGQRNNTIGRLNPADGRVTVFTVPTANSGPHGLISDAQGNIWFTENSAGKIGRLDPRTAQFTEYPMPDPAARDPHTPIFDRRGILWFTLQNANRIGSLEPATSEVRLFTVPTPNSRPYGIKIDSAGAPWFVEFGTNKLARFDVESNTIREFVIPDSNARPRRLAIAPNGDIYFADFQVGRLGRFRPSSNEFKLWDSPSGRQSEPYGIAADAAGIIWYNESGANRIVRFDPRDESFAVVAIPTSGSVVRHMEMDSLGRVWLAESGIDKIGKVEPAPRLTAAGVVNAAGFSGTQIAPGEIISIFGANLAFARTQATAVPLPRALGDTTVTIGGVAAPLYYVSPEQINAQASFELPPGNAALVVRQVGTGQEMAVTVAVAPTAPGIFVEGDGFTAAMLPAQGAATNSGAAATFFVTLFASGLGAVSPPAPTGAAANAQEPLQRTLQTVTVTAERCTSAGARVADYQPRVSYAGLAPGFVGLYQLNVQLECGTCLNSQVTVSAGGVTSRAARLRPSAPVAACP